jgi:hypothetical protein
VHFIRTVSKLENLIESRRERGREGREGEEGGREGESREEERGGRMEEKGEENQKRISTIEISFYSFIHPPI